MIYQIRTKFLPLCNVNNIIVLCKIIRGGVEEARSLGLGRKKNPRPRTVLPRTDPLEAKERNARGEGQGLKTQAQVFSKKNKSLQNHFLGDLQKKNIFQKIFQALHKLLTTQKIVLSSSRRQANFWGLEASRPSTWPLRPKPKTSKCVLEAKDLFEDSTYENNVQQYYYQALFCVFAILLQCLTTSLFNL